MTRASGRPSGSTSSTDSASRSVSGRASVSGLPGSLKPVTGAAAPVTISSRSSSSVGLGWCWGGVGTRLILPSGRVPRSGRWAAHRGRLACPACLLQCRWPRSSARVSSRATTTGPWSRSTSTGTVAWAVGVVDEPMLPRSCNKPVQALGHGPRRARPAARPARPGLRLAQRGADPHRGGAADPGAGGPRRGRPADPGRLPPRRARPRAGHPRRRRTIADPDELLGQARRDAGHLRAQRLGHRDLPRRRAPVAAGAARRRSRS